MWCNNNIEWGTENDLASKVVNMGGNDIVYIMLGAVQSLCLSLDLAYGYRI